MVPTDSSSSGGSEWTPQKIATTLTLLKTIVGPAGRSLLAPSGD